MCRDHRRCAGGPSWHGVDYPPGSLPPRSGRGWYRRAGHAAGHGCWALAGEAPDPANGAAGHMCPARGCRRDARRVPRARWSTWRPPSRSRGRRWARRWASCSPATAATASGCAPPRWSPPIQVGGGDRSALRLQPAANGGGDDRSAGAARLGRGHPVRARCRRPRVSVWGVGNRADRDRPALANRPRPRCRVPDAWRSATGSAPGTCSAPRASARPRIDHPALGYPAAGRFTGDEVLRCAADQPGVEPQLGDDYTIPCDMTEGALRAVLGSLTWTNRPDSGWFRPSPACACSVRAHRGGPVGAEAMALFAAVDDEPEQAPPE